MDDLIALRNAVLRHRIKLRRPLEDSAGLRLADRLHRLHRLHLSWLAVPLVMLSSWRIFLVGRPPAVLASEEPILALYRQHTDKDRDLARADVQRLTRQLFALGDAVEGVELEAVADALIAYYLAGRRTDDELLREVLTAWTEWDEIEEQSQARLTRRGWLRERPTVDAQVREDVAFRERYLTGWRRWLDQRARGSSAGPDRR